MCLKELWLYPSQYTYSQKIPLFRGIFLASPEHTSKRYCIFRTFPYTTRTILHPADDTMGSLYEKKEEKPELPLNAFDTIFYSSYMDEDDEMVAVCHRHIILLTNTIITWMFFAAFLPAFVYGLDIPMIDIHISRWIMEIYELIVYIVLIYRIIAWYNDVWIITSNGIIDLTWSLFGQNTRAVGYRHIGTIDIHEHSLMSALFDRGDITLRTTSEDAELILRGAEHPQAIRAYIQYTAKNIQSQDAKKSSIPFDRLLATMQNVIKTQMERDALGLPQDEELTPEEIAERQALERALLQRGTIDLRDKNI